MMKSVLCRNEDMKREKNHMLQQEKQLKERRKPGGQQKQENVAFFTVSLLLNQIDQMEKGEKRDNEASQGNSVRPEHRPCPAAHMICIALHYVFGERW